jgi:hypothetical protein
MSVERSAKRRIAAPVPAKRDVVLWVYDREGVLTSPLEGDRFRSSAAVRECASSDPLSKGVDRELVSRARRR